MIIKKINPKMLYLEKVSYKHINLGWFDWVNASENVRVLNNPPYRYTKSQLEDYLKKIKLKGDLMFAVRNKITKEYFGNIKNNDIDFFHKNCGYGRLIGSQNKKGIGYGQLMLYKICEYAFDKLKMNKIFSPCYADNLKSLYSNLQFGMRISGYFKNHFKKNNKFKDVYYLELTRQEFKEIKKKYK
jgi:RimJ/RimL family protein N-acetyltransferase